MINALGEPQSLLLLGGTSDIALAVAEKYAASGGLRVVLAARPGPRRTDAAARLTALGHDGRRARLRGPRHRQRTRRWWRRPRRVATSTSSLSPSASSVTRRRPGRTTTPQCASPRSTTSDRSASAWRSPSRSARQGHGAIVFLSSVAGERVRRSNFVYGASKAGAGRLLPRPRRGAAPARRRTCSSYGPGSCAPR